jgi:hypothetical protein
VSNFCEFHKKEFIEKQGVAGEVTHSKLDFKDVVRMCVVAVDVIGRAVEIVSCCSSSAQ